MAGKVLELRFPLGGVARAQGFELTGRKEVYTTPWAMNVRSEDSLTGRVRGGSFVADVAGDRPSAIVYRDRTLTFSANVITASRVGDSTDTTLDADLSDMLRPTIFQCSEAAEQGGTVVALVPHKDQFLLCFTATETWVQQGDPLNGARRRVSDEVGIVGPDAWCVAHDTVYFLSSRGLYQVGADGSGLKAVSEEMLPEDLVDVDDDEVKLDYDHASRGVSIHQRVAPSWFYETENNAFWPFDTTTNQSHVLIGPLPLGSTDSRGLIQTLHGIMADGSATVNWHIVPGDTAEEASSNGKAAITAAMAGRDYSAYVQGSGAWSAGRSYTARPRTTAMCACLWLSSTGVWAYEGITMGVVPAGNWR